MSLKEEQFITSFDVLQKEGKALAGVAQWIECQPANQKRSENSNLCKDKMSGVPNGKQQGE